MARLPPLYRLSATIALLLLGVPRAARAEPAPAPPTSARSEQRRLRLQFESGELQGLYEIVLRRCLERLRLASGERVFGGDDGIQQVVTDPATRRQRRRVLADQLSEVL